MGTLHVTFGQFEDVRSKVLANRGEVLLAGVKFTVLPTHKTKSPHSDSLYKQLEPAGAQMSSNAVRRPPHCFNLWRQVKVLQRSGMGSADAQMKDTVRVLCRF